MLILSFFKCDRKSAYKSLPVDPCETRFAAITLKSPMGNKFYASISRNILFGSIASAPRYYIFARIVTEIFTLIFGASAVSFFDDFGAQTPPPLIKEALSSFQKLCALLWAKLKNGKTEIGQSVTFLGLFGSFPAECNGGRLSVRLTDEKARNWAKSIELILAGGWVSYPCLEGLIGKLSFSQTAMFGKFARPQMRALYRKLYRKSYAPSLESREVAALKWRMAILKELNPRVLRAVSKFPDFVIYSDAAPTHCRSRTPFQRGASGGPPHSPGGLLGGPSILEGRLHQDQPHLRFGALGDTRLHLYAPLCAQG